MKLNEDDIEELRKVLRCAHECLEENRLYESIIMLRQVAKQLELWEIDHTLEEYAMPLHYLLDYLSKGQEDPQRKALFHGLLYKTWLAFQSIQFHLVIHSQKASYYRRLTPWNGYQSAEAISQMVNRINQATVQIQAAAHASAPTATPATEEEEMMQQIAHRSKTQSDLFYYLLLHLSWSREDSHIMEQLVNDKRIQPIELCIATSAITLSLMQCYDSRKIVWMFDLLEKSDSNRVKARAIVGLILVIAKLYEVYSNSSLFHTIMAPIQSRMERLFQSEATLKLLRATILQALRQEQTEVAQKYINEQLMPDLLKHSPLKNLKLGPDNLTNLNNLHPLHEEDFNPDWRESERVEKRIKEFGERQQRGEDMQYTAFRQTKRDAFFQEPSHWFFPFDSLQPAIVNLYGYKNQEKNVIFPLAKMHCDSDSYSFCLYAKKLTEMMGKEVSMADEESIQEVISQFSSPSLQDAIRHYLQDLYRYRQLITPSFLFEFPEMTNLLHTYRNLWEAQFFTPEVLQEAGDMLFEYKAYHRAYDHYYDAIRHKSAVPSVHLFQKSGFCLEKISQFKLAIEMYKKADLAKPNDQWTLRHLARCCAKTGQYNEAIIYQDQLQELSPNHFKINLELAQYYDYAKLPDEALNYYHKCYYLQKNSADALRGIASSLFALRRFEQSHQYYTQLIQFGATSSDLVRAGHAAIMVNLTTEGIDLYNQAYRELEKEKFCDKMTDDISHLLSEVDADLDLFSMLLNLIVSMNNPSL